MVVAIKYSLLKIKKITQRYTEETQRYTEKMVLELILTFKNQKNYT
jgi:hypothetical protein